MRALLAGLAWAGLLRHSSANASAVPAPASDLPVQQQHELHWLRDEVARNHATLEHLTAAVHGWDTESALPAAPAAALTPTCAAASCDDCVGQDGCGWCAVAGECRRGTVDGPSGHPCLWEFGQCSAAARPCGSRQGCSACVADGQCGWCAETHSCEAGTPGGPIGATCLGRDGRGIVNLWVHADGLLPSCPAAPAPATDAEMRQELGEVIASATARASTAPPLAVAPTKPPCRLYPTTPTPVTLPPTTPAPTLPPEERTDIYFLPQTTPEPVPEAATSTTSAAPMGANGTTTESTTSSTSSMLAVEEGELPEEVPAEAANSSLVVAGAAQRYELLRR